MEKENCCILLLIGTILVAGLLTGLITYLNKRVSQRKEDRLRILKDSLFYLSILQGILGAFTIPLFLYLTKSDIMQVACKECQINLLVIFGFSLIGGYFSKSILISIANKLDLKAEMENINNKINELKKDAENKNFENVSEVKELKVDDIAKDEEIKNISATETDFDNITVSLLNAFNSSKYRYRSIAGVQKETKVDRMMIAAFIKAFQKRGLMEEKIWNGVTYYGLTDKGREIVLV